MGAHTAAAQAPSNSVVATFAIAGAVVTANGDIYADTNTSGSFCGLWTQCGNVFYGSGPTPAAKESFGGIKARYR